MSVSLPIAMKRGQTFSYAMNVPEEIPDGFLADWVPKAQLRKARSTGPAGLIAEMVCYWIDAATCRQLGFYCKDTSAWPLGPADFDMKFTSPSGVVMRSTTQAFNIVKDVTK